VTDIVFIVDGISKNGELITAADRLKDISVNWQPNLFDKNKEYYKKYTGNRIKFVPLHEIDSFDPNIRYLYFIPMNDWHCTAQQFFFMLDKPTLQRFAENNVGFYFCQDFEMYPNLNLNFFGSYLAWVRLIRDAHAFPQIPIYFAMCAELEPRLKLALRRAFATDIRFVNSPLLTMFSLEEMSKKFVNKGLSFDVASIVQNYLNTPKNKLYMALTRDPKYHRITMMHGLRAFDLLDDGYVSNLIVRPYTNESVAAHQTEYAKKLNEDMATKGAMPFMEVDKLPDDLTPGIYHGIGGDIPFDYMTTSCFDLVQETATRYDVLDPVVDMAVITEKIIKSLVFGRPFIINGGPGCLRVLRRWGFKTYDFLFDESYDDKTHFLDRQEILISNVKRYKNLHSDFMQLVRENAGYIEYNSKRMLEFPLEDVMVDAILNPWQ
jgi:hypothetical protein